MAEGVKLDYLSVGGNRHPSSADWSTAHGGLLAYGAGNSIALWSPLSSKHEGVIALLNGHTDSVNAVKFLQATQDEATIISGSVDKTVRAWKVTANGIRNGIYQSEVIGEHSSSVTTLEVLPASNIIVSAGADFNVKIWDLSSWTEDGKQGIKLLETVKLKLMPLTIAVHELDSKHKILAVGGSHSSIQIFVTQLDGNLGLVATLAGHAGWIRSLSFIHETTKTDADLLLSSASQDKFIRLWRIHIGNSLPTAKAIDDPALGMIGRSMSTKVHRFSLGNSQASITFEALLLGHEDWIYTSRWYRHNEKLQLLSASADNSLAIWEADAQSGIWVCISRLGEISAQKGSTTATGSTGGFWIGLWSPAGDAVVSLGRTGSWRVWRPEGDDMWTQSIGIGGHVRSVSDIAWTRDGSYLLSTSADQTARLHAEWKRSSSKSWHEFARPQIHGYDLNCIDTISSTSFVSGADEKPIRVFQEPSAVATILSKLCGITSQSDLPSAANMPVLGLSNKEIEASTSTDTPTDSDTTATITSLSHPPLEDTLSRHLLFPELHKIYGHGLELSALSVSSPIPSNNHTSTDNNAIQILASTCRASSLDHAVIRLHCTPSWREYSSPLQAHSLTVTALQWSPDSAYLLSVGRDRIFSLFAHVPSPEAGGRKVELLCTVKGHARMILACSWAPLLPDSGRGGGRIFVTAGRDKCVKIWMLTSSAPAETETEAGVDSEKCKLLATITAAAPVTAVAVSPFLQEDGKFLIAMGLETGSVLLVDYMPTETGDVDAREIPRALCPSKSITKLSWRPCSVGGERALAVASEDTSLRIMLV